MIDDWESHTGTCVAFCQGSEETCAQDPPSCCPAGSYCEIVAAAIIRLCVEECDPILQDCAPGQACYWFDGYFQCLPDSSGDLGSVGDPCVPPNTCDPGLSCEDPASFSGCDPMATGCCLPYCTLDMPECPPETECLPWYRQGDAPAGFEDIGVCRSPP